ncbi:MAG: hypothetical protein ACHQ9S_18405 [Candidatus Binatia bacterium]
MHAQPDRGFGTARRKGAARRELIRVATEAIVGRGIRLVDVSRRLGIATASVAEHPAAIRTERNGSYPIL